MALMSEYLLLLVGTVFVNNIVLVKFLGLCPFMGVSRKVETAIGMSAATTFVLTLSAVLSYMIESWILAPLGLEFLRTIAFIIAIAAVVNFTELVVHKTSPLLYNVLGIFLPLITTNCAVLGVALINVQEANSFIESAIYGFGAARACDDAVRAGGNGGYREARLTVRRGGRCRSARRRRCRTTFASRRSGSSRCVARGQSGRW